jgi:hypothetical protein
MHFGGARGAALNKPLRLSFPRLQAGYPARMRGHAFPLLLEVVVGRPARLPGKPLRREAIALFADVVGRKIDKRSHEIASDAMQAVFLGPAGFAGGRNRHRRFSTRAPVPNNYDLNFTTTGSV